MRRRTGLFRAAVRASIAAATLLLPAAALAQQSNPVYLDDSPAAAEALQRAGELSRSGNLPEAARVLQRVLEDDADRAMASPTGRDLFVTVRARLHDALLADPALLARYREAEEPAARRLLDAGETESVERSRFLTTAGFEATLRLAERRMERAQFWSAWRTLAQLESHPDWARGAPDAARLALRLSAYIDEPAVAETARSWASLVGEEDAPADDPGEPGVAVGTSPFDVASAIDTRGLLSKPLWSVPFSPLHVEEGAQDANNRGVGAEQSRRPPQLYVFPTVAGDTVYVNTGTSIAAWDRFTLTPRWPIREFTAPPFSALDSRSEIEDSATIAVSEPWIVATSGLTRRNVPRSGDPRIHGLDAHTGRILWSVDVEGLDPSLEEAWVRGPAIIDQGVAVVAAIKQVQQRRLVSVTLLGLDVATGRLLWRRPLASAGALPHGQQEIMSTVGALWRGLTIRTDRVGLVSAVETATGRLRWARRIESDSMQFLTQRPWETPATLVHDGTVYTLAPDQRSIRAYDAETGETRGEALAKALDHPDYLLIAGDSLVGVSGDGVFAGPLTLSRLQTEARRVLPPGAGAVRGRIVVSGDRLIAPVSDGFYIVPLRPGAEPSHVSLDQAGLILPLADAMIVTDDRQVHTYLIWDEAQRMLTERLRNDPGDIAAAVTFAELAYRAGKPDAILPAVDKAFDALRAASDRGGSENARTRLFEALLSMVSPGDEPRPPLPDAVILGALDRLGALASAPDERVAHLLAAGAHAEARGDGSLAASRFQSILDDPALARASHARLGVAVRADLEATRRLQRVVRRFGAGVYAVYEAEARAALAKAEAANDARAYERIATAWPVSEAAARAWLLAAEDHERSGREALATRTLEQGLQAAIDARAKDEALVGELAGRLVLALETEGRARAARDVLLRMERERPTLALLDGEETIDPSALASRLDERIASIDRRPRLGAPLASREPQTLPGWTVASALMTPDAGPTPGHVVLENQTGELSLFTPAEAGGVERVWSLPITTGTQLVRVDHDAIYLSEQTDGARGGRTLTRVGVEPGDPRPLWTTQPFRSLFSEASMRADPRLAAAFGDDRTVTVSTPLAGLVRITDLVVTSDDRTAAMLERSGRAAAFDLASGKTLWTQEATTGVVYDAATTAGMVAVLGVDSPQRADEADGLDAALVAYDLRTGRPVHRAAPMLGEPRWLRAGESGVVVAGFDDGVVCVDLLRGQTRWTIRAPAARSTVNAWMFPGRVIVMGPEEADGTAPLWQIEIEDGTVRAEPLDAAGRIRRRDAIAARAIGDTAAFLSARGIVLYDRTGAVAGRDVRPDDAPVLRPLVASDVFVSLDADSRLDDGEYILRLATVRSVAQREERRLVLGAAPFTMAAIDERLLVTAGDVTIVYDAPARP